MFAGVFLLTALAPASIAVSSTGPLSPSWGKLDLELRAAALSDPPPAYLDVIVHMRVPERLLNPDPIFVPYWPDYRLYSMLTREDMEVLEDYWKSYDNVPGESQLPSAQHLLVIEKAMRLVEDTNEATTWPRLQSLISRLANLEGIELRLSEFQRSLHSVRARVTPAAIDHLALDRDVSAISLESMVVPQLDNSMNTIDVGYVWAQGYFGSGVRAGIIDTGVRTHSNLVITESMAFGGGTDTNDYCGHGTRVAGIIRSNHATYQGAAYQSSLYNAKASTPYDCPGTASAIQNAALWLTDTNPGKPQVKIVSTSMANETEDDGNHFLSRFFDWLAGYRLVLFVQAAGNDRDPPVGKVFVPGAAYNVLTVGASDDKNSPSRLGDEVWSGSRRGVLNSNRGKPDMIAPGKDIKSTDLSGGFSDDTGTSYAAPHVAGLAALLRQRYPISDSLMLKARLINGDYFWRSHPWDPTWAWSYIDAFKSYWSGSTYSGYVNNGQTWSTSVYLPAFYTVTFTLVWNREMNSQYQVIGLSNLNLEVSCPNGAKDTSSSTVDNVERVSLTTAPGQTCTLKVIGASVPPAIFTQAFRVVGFTL